MELVKFTVLISFALTWFYLEVESKSRPMGFFLPTTVRLTNVVCDNRKSKTLKNVTCRVKSYGRNNTVFDASLETIRDIPHGTNWKWRYIVYYKFASVYSPVMNLTLEDICKFIDGEDNNIFFKKAVSVMQMYSPTFLASPCPYPAGKFTHYNVSLTEAYKKFLPIFPRGDYKSETTAWDDLDPNMLQFTFYSSINSAIQKW